MIRRLVRGNVAWERLETVVRELADRYDKETAHVRFLDADNWLSTPFVLDEEHFVKVMTRQNSAVHALFTAGRNLGAVSAGAEGFFEHFGTPYQMATHELEATRQMRAAGVNAPEPVEAVEIDGLGVLVLAYLDGFKPLDEVSRERARSLAPAVFRSLARLHETGLAHGDVRAENVLVVNDELYFIDATNVREPDADPTGATDPHREASEYDVASALAALAPIVGTTHAVEAASRVYDTDRLLGALEYLSVVDVRPDHDFDATGLRGEIESRAARAEPTDGGTPIDGSEG